MRIRVIPKCLGRRKGFVLRVPTGGFQATSAHISTLFLVVQVVQGVYKARLTRANACTTCKSPRGTPAMRSPVNPCLTCGNRCTTSSGTPSDTPDGYVVHAGAGALRRGLLAGRSEELLGPRPGGRAAYAARGWVIEHEKPVAPWGIRPRSHCFSFQTPRSRRERRWRPSGLARDPSEPSPGISRNPCRPISRHESDSLRKTTRMD
jgi:hypothetical protein